jgi:hypothetical protein
MAAASGSRRQNSSVPGPGSDVGISVGGKSDAVWSQPAPTYIPEMGVQAMPARAPVFPGGEYTTPIERSTFYCSYSFLVEDILGTDPVEAAKRCKQLQLVTNVVSFFVTGLMGFLLGAAASASIIQLVVMIVIKGVQILYLLMSRPYAGLLTYCGEVVFTTLETMVITMALLQFMNVFASAGAIAAILVLLMVGLLSVIEIGRAFYLIFAMLNQDRSSKGRVRAF